MHLPQFHSNSRWDIFTEHETDFSAEENVKGRITVRGIHPAVIVNVCKNLTLANLAELELFESFELIRYFSPDHSDEQTDKQIFDHLWPSLLAFENNSNGS